MKRLIGEQAVTVGRYRNVEETRQTAYGEQRSVRSVQIGTKTATVELIIDVEELLRQIGARALRSKSGKSRLSGGLIEARVRRGTLREEDRND